MDARLQCGARLYCPKRDGASERHDVGLGVDDLAPVCRRVPEAEAVPQQGELRGVAPIHDPGRHLRVSEESRDVREGRPGAGTDDPQTKLVYAGEPGRCVSRRVPHVMIQPPLTSIVAPLI